MQRLGYSTDQAYPCGGTLVFSFLIECSPFVSRNYSSLSNLPNALQLMLFLFYASLGSLGKLN